MPGVLFHHETAMRDSFYDDIKPWVHYVPIMEDMSDLKKQYIWAMNNPDEIKAISKRATQYVKDAIKPSGLKQHAQHFVSVMQKYINSYSVDPEDKDLIARVCGKIWAKVRFRWRAIYRGWGRLWIGINDQFVILYITL